MIQRIQSVYLFLAAIILFSMFFHPLAEMLDAGKTFYQFDLSGIYEGMGDTAKKIESVLPLRFLVIVTAALSFITIFFYKRRILQLRICIFNLILLIGFYGLFLFYFFFMRNQLDASVTSLKITIVFPFIALILVFLATRGIRRDELLVRSYNRIR
ncbi:MAG: DUF4293 domain-containing protein [Bacteroidales bacterium]